MAHQICQGQLPSRWSIIKVELWLNWQSWSLLLALCPYLNTSSTTCNVLYSARDCYMYMYVSCVLLRAIYIYAEYIRLLYMLWEIGKWFHISLNRLPIPMWLSLLGGHRSARTRTYVYMHVYGILETVMYIWQTWSWKHDTYFYNTLYVQLINQLYMCI